MTPDKAILLFLNRFAHRTPLFDMTVDAVSESRLLKGGVMMAVVWGLWFSAAAGSVEVARMRRRLIATLVGAFVALVLARGMVVSLPFRARPLTQTAWWQPVAKAGLQSQDSLHKESSFPSDHAALYCSMVSSFFFVSRRAGWLTFAYTTIMILLPRLYLGKHYPSDLLAGGVIGFTAAAATAWLTERVWPFRSLVASVVAQADRRPILFYGCLFAITFLVAEHFESVRVLFQPRTAIRMMLSRDHAW